MTRERDGDGRGAWSRSGSWRRSRASLCAWGTRRGSDGTKRSEPGARRARGHIARPSRPLDPVDAGDDASVASAFERAKAELGAPEVLVYNAGAFQRGSIVDTALEEFERCLRVNCTGAFLAAKCVLPNMLERGRGTILLTGATASLRGTTNFACLAVGKFGLRALAQSVARVSRGGVSDPAGAPKLIHPGAGKVIHP